MKTTNILSILLFFFIGILINAQEIQPKLTQTKLEEIDKFIIKNQKKWKTPGLSIAIINGENDIQFRNYGYSNKEESLEVSKHTLFEIGSTSKAFNHEFKSGEITFITGGNGSGKTTLAKLITGLYEPEEGQICINGKEVNYTDLNNCYSSVFSDYFLFNKLYGINHVEKSEDIERILKSLQINDKLTINDGVFSTVDLSSGQKKRLALLVSYLDDRPIFLFDEWAADQDPEFRKYFYHEILPGLKALGKCVIAITHDDHYFDTADKVIKLEMGKIESVEEKEAVLN